MMQMQVGGARGILASRCDVAGHGAFAALICADHGTGSWRCRRTVSLVDRASVRSLCKHGYQRNRLLILFSFLSACFAHIITMQMGMGMMPGMGGPGGWCKPLHYVVQCGSLHAVVDRIVQPCCCCHESPCGSCSCVYAAVAVPPFAVVAQHTALFVSQKVALHPCRPERTGMRRIMHSHALLQAKCGKANKRTRPNYRLCPLLSGHLQRFCKPKSSCWKRLGLSRRMVGWCRAMPVVAVQRQVTRQRRRSSDGEFCVEGRAALSGVSVLTYIRISEIVVRRYAPQAASCSTRYCKAGS